MSCIANCIREAADTAYGFNMDKAVQPEASGSPDQQVQTLHSPNGLPAAGPQSWLCQVDGKASSSGIQEGSKHSGLMVITYRSPVCWVPQVYSRQQQVQNKHEAPDSCSCTFTSPCPGLSLPSNACPAKRLLLVGQDNSAYLEVAKILLPKLHFLLLPSHLPRLRRQLVSRKVCGPTLGGAAPVHLS